MPINRAGTVADQGSYFTANNAATGVATAAAPTAYSDTAPFCTITNLGTLGSSGRSIYLDWARIYETAAGTGGVAMFLKAQLDQTTPTGGTLLVAKSTNTLDGAASVAAIRLLPTGIAATGNVRVIIGNHGVVPTQTTPLAVNTEVFLAFSAGLGEQPALVTSGAAVGAVFSKNSYTWPPIVISPGWSLSIEHLITTQSATSSWAFEFGWIEN
jgi:hypothetical protein